jgi:Class II flagellar assembly regulator
MKITDANSSSKISSAKRKKNVGGSAGTSAFSDIFGAASESAEVSSTPAPVNIGSVISPDSLGFLNNINNEEYTKKQNIEWGNDILKTLEGIKYQILNGKISYGSLLDLNQRLNNIPLNSADFKLKQIIEEIEVRAAVELEKYKKLSQETKLFNDDSVFN